MHNQISQTCAGLILLIMLWRLSVLFQWNLLCSWRKCWSYCYELCHMCRQRSELLEQGRPVRYNPILHVYLDYLNQYLSCELFYARYRCNYCPTYYCFIFFNFTFTFLKPFFLSNAKLRNAHALTSQIALVLQSNCECGTCSRSLLSNCLRRGSSPYSLRYSTTALTNRPQDNYGWATCPKLLSIGLRYIRTCKPAVTRHRTYKAQKIGLYTVDAT